MLILAIMATGAANSDYGARPTFQDAVAISEAAARSKLVDPDSAKFEWPYNFVSGTLKPLLGRTRAGYWTCGRVNSRNRMGGYSGQSWILVMVRDGAVTMLEIGESDTIDVASVNCDSAMKNNLLPLVPSTALGTSNQNVNETPVAPAPGQIGITFQPSPIGALVLTVAAGSLGEKVGLKPGMVISAVNGVPTKDFPPAQMIALIKTPGKRIVFSILGGSDVTIDR